VSHWYPAWGQEGRGRRAGGEGSGRAEGDEEVLASEVVMFVTNE
jgi:hypothetical protein